MTPRYKGRPGRRRRVLPLRRGYSLAAVFLLVATIAVLAAMARSLFSLRNVPWEVLGTNVVIGLLGGGLIGGTIGIHYPRRVRSTVVGMMAGSASGLIAAAITVADLDALAVLIDCALLIGLAVFVRMMATGRPKPSAVLYNDRPAIRIPFSHAHRGRLAGAIVMGACTVVALERLISGTSGASTAADWRQGLSHLAVALCSLGLAAWLFWTAVRKRASLPERSASPWD